jgi:streptogramin lyase
LRLRAAALLVLVVVGACGSPAAPASSPAAHDACTPLTIPHQAIQLQAANDPTPGFALRPETKPVGIAIDNDGSSAWVLGTGLSHVVHVMPDGKAVEYALPMSELGLKASQAADGTVWVPEQYRDAVAAIAPDGTVKECKVPHGSSEPVATAIGADGSVWISAGPAVDRLVAGRFTIYPLGIAGASAAEVIADPAGGAWFTVHGAPVLGRVTPGGEVQRIPIGGSGTNLGLLLAPDGAVWVADFGGDRVVRVAPDGSATELKVTPGAKPQSLAQGPGGVLWLTESGADRVGRISGGTVVEAIKTGRWPDHMAVTADGWAWFTEYYPDRIGRVRLPA